MMNVKNMEVGLSPPYGDCIRMTTPKYPVMELSSPYGDCTETINHYQSKIQFSSPYGDRTDPASSLVVDG